MKRIYLWHLAILCIAVLISLALVGDTRSPGQDGGITVLSSEPSDSFIFQLVFEGDVVAEYTECFGLGSNNEIEEAVVQTDAGAVTHKMPGALQWRNIVLKRVGPSGAQIWSLWRKAMEDGDLDEAIRDGAIIMRKAGSSEPVARWNFTHGWPAALTIEGSIEELTIVHEGLERTATGDAIDPKKR